MTHNACMPPPGLVWPFPSTPQRGPIGGTKDGSSHYHGSQDGRPSSLPPCRPVTQRLGSHASPRVSPGNGFTSRPTAPLLWDAVAASAPHGLPGTGKTKHEGDTVPPRPHDYHLLIHIND